MKTIAIIQARMGSTRLPGKVMKDLAGEPMLVRVVQRTCRAKSLDDVVIATTIQPGDDRIEDLCKTKNWNYFRGSETDVLDRYYQAACYYQADVVVRITSDCPLIEPEIIDTVVGEFHKRQPDVGYVCMDIPKRTFPHGLDVQVLRFDVLQHIWHEDCNLAWREHVVEFIDHNQQLFRIYSVTSEVDRSYMRWTVDTPEDLEFVRKIYNHFGHANFSWHDVLAVLDEYPEWLEINRLVL